ncbi:MAG: hypothetical protein CL927_03905 [Deltaproteobacteria bacterium]|nr:hypothetical protein [Deltaproteobacteria bacterium]HCH61865.1 hypothetical protein [Deltaproteobacteria bacterium]
MRFQPAARTAAFRALAATQPGCTPYHNHRPIFIRKHSEGQTLASLLAQVRPYSQDASLMERHRARGWLTVDHKSVGLERVLVAGNIVRMVIPDTVEPAISPDLLVLHEDHDILVIAKPSPLPMHPSGRFNKNTLVWLAREAWPDLTLKPVHRLDANTTGVLVCGKTAPAARSLVAQFRERRVQKHYIARVHGAPDTPELTIDAPIAQRPSKAGTRSIQPDGQTARTDVRLLRRFSDGTSLLELRPHTGRTHQIRLHLQTVGLPIVGENAYTGDANPTTGFTRADPSLCLHATRIGFHHPTTEVWMEHAAPPPPWHAHETSAPSQPAR